MDEANLRAFGQTHEMAAAASYAENVRVFRKGGATTSVFKVHIPGYCPCLSARIDHCTKNSGLREAARDPGDRQVWHRIGTTS
jgi:hypothetical protein